MFYQIPRLGPVISKNLFFFLFLFFAFFVVVAVVVVLRFANGSPAIISHWLKSFVKSVIRTSRRPIPRTTNRSGSATHTFIKSCTSTNGYTFTEVWCVCAPVWYLGHRRSIKAQQKLLSATFPTCIFFTSKNLRRADIRQKALTPVFTILLLFVHFAENGPRKHAYTIPFDKQRATGTERELHGQRERERDRES